MRIAFTNNVFPVGPDTAYGGERIIYYLAEALAKLGHDIVFFSREGSVPPPGVKDYIPVPEMCNERDVYLDAAKQYASDHNIKFDIFQCNYFGEGWKEEALTFAPVYVELVWNRWCHEKWQLRRTPHNVVSYSKVLQSHFLEVGVETTMIHYGLPKELYEFSSEHDGYAFWIGKIEGGKAPALAIKTALAAGLKIVMMGPPYNTGTFWNEVAPYIDNKNVFWVRGVDDKMKNKIMRRAKVFISSNRADWTEHAGIVNIESLACGTPILAFNNIDRPSAIWTDQIIRDENEGFFLNFTQNEEDDSIIEKGVGLLNKIVTIDRTACRKRFEEMFIADLQAQRFDYLYQHIANNGNVTSIEIPF